MENLINCRPGEVNRTDLVSMLLYVLRFGPLDDGPNREFRNYEICFLCFILDNLPSKKISNSFPHPEESLSLFQRKVV